MLKEARTNYQSRWWPKSSDEISSRQPARYMVGEETKTPLGFILNNKGKKIICLTAEARKLDLKMPIKTRLKLLEWELIKNYGPDRYRLISIEKEDAQETGMSLTLAELIKSVQNDYRIYLLPNSKQYIPE
jgi:hypothetical protein